MKLSGKGNTLLCDHTELDLKPSSICVALKKWYDVQERNNGNNQWECFALELSVRSQGSAACQKYSVDSN